MWEIIRNFFINTYAEHIKCPYCNERFIRLANEEWKHCPNCGIKIKGEKNE